MVGANPKLAGQVDTIQEIIKRTADPKTLVKIVVAYPDWMSPTRYTAMGVSTPLRCPGSIKVSNEPH
jgi:hypothetical protein